MNPINTNTSPVTGSNTSATPDSSPGGEEQQNPTSSQASRSGRSNGRHCTYVHRDVLTSSLARIVVEPMGQVSTSMIAAVATTTHAPNTDVENIAALHSISQYIM